MGDPLYTYIVSYWDRWVEIVNGIWTRYLGFGVSDLGFRIQAILCINLVLDSGCCGPATMVTAAWLSTCGSMLPDKE